jgi:predicted DNA-binding protein (UPF0251 family)
MDSSPPRPLVHLEAEKEEKVDSSMNETQVLRVHSTKEIAIQNHATQYAIDRHNLQTVESAGGEVAQRKGRISYGREKLLAAEMLKYQLESPKEIFHASKTMIII